MALSITNLDGTLNCPQETFYKAWAAFARRKNDQPQHIDLKKVCWRDGFAIEHLGGVVGPVNAERMPLDALVSRLEAFAGVGEITHWVIQFDLILPGRRRFTLQSILASMFDEGGLYQLDEENIGACLFNPKDERSLMRLTYNHTKRKLSFKLEALQADWFCARLKSFAQKAAKLTGQTRPRVAKHIAPCIRCAAVHVTSDPVREALAIGLPFAVPETNPLTWSLRGPINSYNFKPLETYQANGQTHTFSFSSYYCAVDVRGRMIEGYPAGLGFSDDGLLFLRHADYGVFRERALALAAWAGLNWAPLLPEAPAAPQQ